MGTPEDLEALACFLIESAASAEGGNAQRWEAIARLRPEIERIVRHRGFRQGATDELIADCVQEVCQRLYDSGPSQRKEGIDCLRIVLAWVKTTAYRWYSDQRGRARVRGEHLTLGAQQDGAPGRSRSSFGGLNVVEDRFDLERCLTYLETHYPRGVDLLKAKWADPDATSAELAEDLGISANNIDQIWHRLRLHLVRFRQSRPS
jgi:DNA-directed RNA polymerase specialized sigma24 family protein